MTYEQKFAALKNMPPNPTVPAGCNYTLFRKVGNLLVLSGSGPIWGSTIPPEYVGKIGDKGLTVKVGYEAARLTAMNLLLVVRQAIGTLDDVAYIVSVDGLVNCTSEFQNQPDVINGCSDLLIDIFGDDGKHTRTASGANALAFNIAVEISMTLVTK